MRTILCLTGPTAVGKSQLALQVASKLRCRIISADSMQIYKGFDVGTAKPSTEEQMKIKHEMIDVVEPTESYSSFNYKQAVSGIISDMNDNEVPFVVGGTAFYIDSLLYKLDFDYTQESEQLRIELWKYYDEHGVDALHELLLNEDRVSAEKIHKNNVKRVIRALEIARSGKRRYDNSNGREKEHEYVLFALNMPRNELYERINQRVDGMMNCGLLDEVSRLYLSYHDKSLQCMQAIGYKELIEYIDGNISLQDAIELIKKNSRNYAKRQITYLKRMNPVWLDAKGDIDDLTCEIIEKYRNYSQK